MKITTAIVGLGLLAIGASSAETDLRTRFAWRQPLRGDLDPGALYRIDAPSEMFDGCARFPNDLRIIDENGLQWPFYLWELEPRTGEVRLDTRKLNESVVDQPVRYYRLDLQILPDFKTKQRAIHNHVVIQSPGSDFTRKVEIYGSEDQKAWGLLGVGYLIDHSPSTERIRNRTIQYPESNFPYLQVRIYPNAKNALEDLSGQQVFPGFYRWHTVEMKAVPLQSLPVPDEELKESCQVLLFDTRAMNRPVDWLIIEAAQEDYARPVKLYARNAATNTWRWLSDSEIHRIDGQIRNTIELTHCMYRFLKIEAYHYDDQPLKITRFEASASPRYLVFEPPPNAGPRPAIFYGSVFSEVPQYDLKRRKGLEYAAQAPLVELEPREGNTLLKPPPWRRYGKGLAAMAVGIVSALVLWIVVNMMRRQSKL